jgi:UDP-N-acetylglucosamine 2-epimerase (non-hydrolysing)
MTELVFVLGTRPEIIKLSPVIRRCQSLGIDFEIIHTGQHYSENLSSVFFDQLSLPQPDYNLDIRSGTHSTQTGQMMIELGELIAEIDPQTVLVQGDTNSVLAASMTVSKMDSTLGHVEAGLRSYNRSMPEEINRVVSDHVGEYLFAPTPQSVKYLQNEGISDDRIYETGNTIVEATRDNSELAESESTILEELGLNSGEYCLLTAHRAENVDSRSVFTSIIEGVGAFAAQHELPVVFPAHPRTQKRIGEFDLTIPNHIAVIDSLDYLDFLTIQRNASLVFTDSGGVQEEACILHVPCVTIRTETERPETVTVGANVVADVTADSIQSSGNDMIDVDRKWDNPFGDGHAAERILEILSFTES